MSDVFSKHKRSGIMAAVRGSRNKTTEIKLIAFFRVAGIKGWRRGSKLFGKPDFVFRAAQVVVFVDGCFWHGCPKHGTVPVGNAEFWKQKLRTNKTRDRRVTTRLRAKGWHVLRIWEHDLRAANVLPHLRRIQAAIGVKSPAPADGG